MDAFIQSFSEISKQFLPILGATALVCLIIFLIKLIKITQNLNNTVDKTNTTIDLVDDSIEKIQEPLNTVVKVSHSVDKAYDVTIAAVDATKDFVIKHAEEAKDKIVELISKDSNDKVDQEDED